MPSTVAGYLAKVVVVTAVLVLLGVLVFIGLVLYAYEANQPAIPT
jgi:hypothetical protein